MKYFVLIVLAAMVLQPLIVGVESCDCNYHPGGCKISKAPAAGSKCKCRYKGGWTCDGLEIQCDDKSKCPGNCSSRKCCLKGGGDCGAY